MYCRFRPSQATAGLRLVDLQSNLGLVKNLSSLDWLFLVACAKGPQASKNTKEFKFSFRAASTLEQF